MNLQNEGVFTEMLGQLLQLDTIQKIFLNTLLVSIPEELFLLMFTLILVGEFEFWADEECRKLINRWDYTRILVPTLTVALLSNIERYSDLNSSFASLIPIVVFFILIVLTNDIFGDASAMKWTGKALLFFILGFIILYISEFCYTSFILYGTGKTITEINNNILLNFLISLPSRLIEYSILIFLVVKRRTLLKANIIRPIFESKITTFLTFIVVIFDFVFMFVMVKAICYEKVLVNIPSDLRTLVIMGISLFPVINLSGLIWGLYAMKDGEIQANKVTSDCLYNLLNEITLYTNNDKFDNIKWKLNEVGLSIEKIAKNLYLTDKKQI